MSVRCRSTTLRAVEMNVIFKSVLRYIEPLFHFLFRISFCSFSFSRLLVKICHKLSTAKYLRYVLLSLRLAANVNVDSLIGLASPLFQCLYIYDSYDCVSVGARRFVHGKYRTMTTKLNCLLNCKMNLGKIQSAVCTRLCHLILFYFWS